MNYYAFPEKRIWKAFFCLVLLGLLVLNRDGMYMAVLGLQPGLLASYGLVGLVGIAFLAVNRKQLKDILRDPRIMMALAFGVIMLLPMLVKRDWQLLYINILICLYIAVFFSYFATVKDVARNYVVILTVLGACSLVALYLLRPLTDMGLLSPAVIRNSRKVEIYCYGISFVPISFVKNRNFGIFREPGVYQYFILLAIYLNNYQAEWEKSWKIWVINAILAVTMVSTFATGGVIELALLIAVMFLDKKWYKDKIIRTSALMLAAAGACLVGYCIVQKTGLYYSLREMILKFVNNPESTGARVGSIAVDLEFFLKKPLFGEKLATVLHLRGVSADVVDNTSSTMILYAAYGIVAGTLNVAAWAALVWERKRKAWANLALLVILFMSFNTQNLTWNTFFWLFPVMALTERVLPLVQRGIRKE